MTMRKIRKYANSRLEKNLEIITAISLSLLNYSMAAINVFGDTVKIKLFWEVLYLFRV